jgi:hypothetical protein
MGCVGGTRGDVGGRDFVMVVVWSFFEEPFNWLPRDIGLRL